MGTDASCASRFSNGCDVWRLKQGVPNPQDPGSYGAQLVLFQD
uniref:Uncharacterized protein n=1 Tax=Anguilla anguilla TaxID=7936 RepID=A0A0E9VU55_ANGAN